MRRVRSRRRSRQHFDEACAMYLRTGVHFPFMGPGYFGDGDGVLAKLPEADRDALLEVMRRDWQAYCDAIEIEHSQLHRDWRTNRPWGWWTFEAPEPRDLSRPEWLQLFDVGEITRDEARAAAERELRSKANYAWPAFRRSIAWYFVRDLQRDERTEASQLTGLHRERGDVLDAIELALLEGDEATLVRRYGPDRQRWAMHLTPSERQLLGLPANPETLPAAAAGPRG